MKTIVMVTVGAMFVALPQAALGQSVRTWISANGEDSADCLRTTPCRTWQGALVKTVAGGEIDALDSGPYGTVTIDKSITLDAAEVHAGTIASFTDAIVINNASAKVTIRGVVLSGGRDIPGNTPGPFGINAQAARAVRIEGARISDFQNAGIRVAPTNTPSRTVIKNTVVADNGGNGLGAVAGSSGPAGSVNRITLRNVSLLGNGGHGIGASTPSANRVSVNVFGSEIADNSGDGIRAEGAQARVRISNTDITGNLQSAFRVFGSAQILSWGNNRVADNGVDNNPTGTIATK